MTNKERAAKILSLLEGASFLALASNPTATEFGLRLLIPRKVIDIQDKGNLIYDVTVYKTGCKVVIGREDAVSCDLINVIEAILSQDKGFNFL